MREKEGRKVVKEVLSIDKSFEQRQKDLMQRAMQLSEGAEFWAEGRARANALRPEDACVIGKTACRLVWLEQRQRRAEW